MLYILSLDHLEEPLATFGLSLPQHWGILLGWSLSALPVLPLVLGVLVRLAWVPRGVPLTTVILSIHCKLGNHVHTIAAPQGLPHPY